MAGKTKAGFTLIEIVITLVIMAIIVGTATLSVVSGLKNAHRREAVRTTIGYIRHARAVALVKQRAVALTFEEQNDDTHTFAKSRISLAFSGENTADDPLTVEPKEFPGIHIRVGEREVERRTGISVFSNADALRKRAEAASAKRKEAEEAAAETSGGTDAKKDEKGSAASDAEDNAEESSTALIEANGQCEPYVVKVWKDGEDEDNAVVIEVSKFCKPVVKEDRR